MHRTDDSLSRQDPGSAHPVDTPIVISIHPPDKRIPTTPTSDATGTVTNELSAAQVSECDQGGRSSGLARVYKNSPGRHASPDSNPFICVIPSFLPSEIPPESQTPLSFLGEEKLQVQTSEIAATDLDMRWCVSG